MPIEIIPKEKKEVPPWKPVLFYISLILLLLVISGYFISGFFQKKYETEISNLDNQLIQFKTPEKTKIEDDVKYWEKKIKDFSTVFNEHVFISGVLDFIGRTSHPKVRYTQFELDSIGNAIDLSGETDNFETLGQQVILIENDSMVKKIDLTKVSISEQGKVDFGFNIFLKPEVFKIPK